MDKYEVYEDGLGFFVRHKETERVIPYHSKFSRYAGQCISADFDIWLQASNNQRKRLKQMITTQGITMKDFNKAKKAMMKANVPMTQCFIAQPNTFEFSDCKPAPTPKPSGWVSMSTIYNEEQESNLMAYETKTTAAVASIINAASDESKQREFLMGELRNFTPYDWRTPFDQELEKLFNIRAPKTPAGSQAILDAFANKAFTVDQAKVDANTKYLKAQASDECFDSCDEDGEYVGARYYGIVFTDLPLPDHKGYEAAKKEFKAARTDTIRTIQIGTPAEGLSALKALESWKTTVVPATSPSVTPATSAPTPVAA